MTKTPEELTEEWKAGRLEVDKDYYIKIANNIVIIDYYTQQYDNSHYPHGLGFELSSNKFIKKILAPVPTYDKYKAMQAAIQNGESAIDTNKRLCKTIEELEEKVKDKEELIQCLGSNIDYLDTKKMILIVENNKLRGLLEESRGKIKRLLIDFAYADEADAFEHGNKWSKRDFIKNNKDVYDLVIRINAALNGK